MKNYAGLFLVSLLGTWTVLIILLASASLSYNAMSELSNHRWYQILPQGWAFFTKDAREAQIQLFEQRGEKWVRVDHHHAHYSHFFGVRRATTQKLIELAKLYQDIPPSAFVDCESNIQLERVHCEPDTTITLKNPFDQAFMCGEYLMVCQEIIPWAWSQSMQEIDMPSKAIKIKLLCEN